MMPKAWSNNVGATPYVVSLHHISHRAGITWALHPAKNSTYVFMQNYIQVIFKVH